MACMARTAARPCYRELYRGIDLERAPLRELPPVDKAWLMEHFDVAVTDPALRLAELDAFLRTATTDDLYQGQFRVLLTSGSTGRRGVIVYNRHEWIATLAAALRSNQVLMDKLLLHPWRRSRRCTLPTLRPPASCYRCRPLPPPHDRHARIRSNSPQLQQFQPGVLFGYRSAIAPVARAQVDGRVRLRPQRVIGAGEAVTPAFREAVQEAWGCEVPRPLRDHRDGASAVESPGQGVRYLLEDVTSWRSWTSGAGRSRTASAATMCSSPAWSAPPSR